MMSSAHGDADNALNVVIGKLSDKDLITAKDLIKQFNDHMYNPDYEKELIGELDNDKFSEEFASKILLDSNTNDVCDNPEAVINFCRLKIRDALGDRMKVLKHKRDNLIRQDNEKKEREKAMNPYGLHFKLDNKWNPAESHDKLDITKLHLSILKALTTGLDRDIAISMILYAGEGWLFYISSEDVFYWWSQELLWERCNPEFVMTSLEDKYINHLLQLQLDNAEEMRNTQEESVKSGLYDQNRSITKVIGLLKTTARSNAIMSQIRKLVCDKNEDFFSSLNPVTSWMPLNNGQLFNIFTHESRMRTPKDRYTATINANMDEDSDPDVEAESINYVYNLINRMMSEKERITLFFIMMLGIYISGDIRDKTFQIWYGPSGSNGKSLLLKFLKNLLTKQYCTAAPDGAFFKMKKGEANSHTAHLNMIVGKRLVTHSESTQLELDTVTIRRVSGADELALRKLNHEGETLDKSTAHIVLATNNIPLIPDMDEPIDTRIELIPFNAKFTHDVEGEKAKDRYKDTAVYPIDIDIEYNIKLPRYLNALFKLLAEGARQYYLMRYKFTIPVEVSDAKAKSLTKYGPFGDFVDLECDTTPGQTSRATDLAERFEAFSSEYYNTKFPKWCNSRIAFWKAMETLFGSKRQGRGNFYNVGIKSYPTI